MKKELRLLAGIILHPFKCIYHKFYRTTDEMVIRDRVRQSWWLKNHERMHEMSFLTNTAYTGSDLNADLHHGAL
ncbi:MAG: hypothetical protein IJV08_11420 [Bacteroidaceae bacterium]|nr:hypothetical protein [Bacteroidaceae bacterium]MBR1449533.1 hypothetical protein [Prevotella sp.]